MGLVSEIPQTILEGGRAAAQGAQNLAAIRAGQQERAGQIWGQTLASLGQLPGQVLTQMRQDQEFKLRQQGQANQNALTGLQVDAAKAAKEGEAKANGIVGSLPRKEDGTFDTGGLLQQFASANVPLAEQDRVLKYADGINAVQSSFNKAKIDHQADVADVLLKNHTPNTPYTADDVQMGMATLVSMGIASPADQAKITQALASGGDPEQMLKVARSLGSKFQGQAPIKVGKDETLVDANTLKPVFKGASGEPQNEAELAAAAADPTNPKHQVYADAMKTFKTPVETPEAVAARDAARAETLRHNKADEALSAGRLAVERNKAGAENKPLDLTLGGLDAAALNYMKTGQLPALGMGDKITRKSIINRAAELGSGTGDPIRTNLDLASNRAGFVADEGSLKKLQGQRDAITAFENTASKNIDQFLKTAGKVVDTGSPLLNAPLRAISAKLLGSPDQAAYEAARQVAINEVAKVTGNPTLSGTLSDSARKEVEAFNPSNATLGQTVAVLKLLKQDMANRADATDAAIGEIKKRIGGSQTPAATSAPAAPAGWKYVPKPSGGWTAVQAQ